MTPTPFRIFVRRAAAREIANQTRYFRQKASTLVAARWEVAAGDAVMSLKTMPDRGAQIVLENDAITTMRRLPIPGFPNHLLFYSVDAEAHKITVLHMLHGARDLPTSL